MAQAARGEPRDRGVAGRLGRALVITDGLLIGEAMARLMAQIGWDAVHLTPDELVDGAAEVRGRVDVAVVDGDVQLQPLTGVVSKLVSYVARTHVLLLGEHGLDPRPGRSRDLGVAGCVGRDCDLEVFQQALRLAGSGRRLLPLRLDDRPAGEVEARARSKPVVPRLTTRERQILELLAGGQSAEEIAASLSLSPLTVRTHIHNAMGRLGAATRLEAVTLLRQEEAPVASSTMRVRGEAIPSHHDPLAGPRRTVLIGSARSLDRIAYGAALEIGSHQVVALAHDCSSVVALARESRPDLVFLADDAWGAAAEACEEVKRLGSASRVLVVGKRSLESLEAALGAGADGYLTGEASLAELNFALARMWAGEAIVPPDMLGGLLRSLIRLRREEDNVVEKFSHLSGRERAVLALLVEGMDHETMAGILVVSPHTARTHIQNVIKKLGVHSRLEAVTLAKTYELLERFGTGTGGQA